MNQRFEIIDALVDGEPVDRAALEDALSDRAARDYLIDTWTLRGLVQDEMAVEPAPAPSASGAPRRVWLVAAALAGVCLVGGYLTGARFPILSPAPPAVTAPPAATIAPASRAYPLPPATRVIRLELDPNWKEPSGGR
jgi:hypothetical protein